MELLYASYANTTTQFVVNDNTSSVTHILNPDVRFQFASDSFGNDLTTVTMRINFDSTLTVSRIAMCGHNLKSFDVYYNGVTANGFALTTGSLSSPNTTTSKYTTNSDTSHYFTCTPVACTSVSIDMRSTIVADQQKYIGYLAISDVITDFEKRIPSAEQYNPTLKPENVVHRMSDGGTRIHTLEDKWHVNIQFDYITEDSRDELKEVWDDHREMLFCPLGTTTSWDGFIFPCVWGGSFNFYKYSDNAAVSGFSGNIDLMETPT